MRRGHLIGGVAILMVVAALCAPYAFATGGSTAGQGYPCATAPAGSSCNNAGGPAGVSQQQAAGPNTAGGVAPARTSGALPFTGLQLGVFVVLGVLLIGGGLVLRASGRRHGEF